MTGGGIGNELQQAGIPVIWLEADRHGVSSAAWRLFRVLREGVDVLHAFLFHSNLMGRIVGTLAGVHPVIVSERSVESTKAQWRVYADRLTWRLAERWTANSHTVARVLEKREGVDARRIDVIRNGVDLAYFGAEVDQIQFRSLVGLSAGDRMVVCVGRLDPLKGHSTLLEAFREVSQQEPNVRLCLVGDGALRVSLAQQADDMRLSGLVNFVGTLTDVRPALAAADVFVLPSNEEGLPGSVIEAQAAGVPVIATSVGGTPELVQHGRTGLLVPPRDPAALSAAILELLGDPARALELSTAAKAAVQELSIDRMVDATLEMYLRIGRRMRTTGAEAA